MSTNRAALYGKLQKVLKKHYKPATPVGDRPVLEHVLYACCLENSRYEAADEAFARLQLYADWNEVRVTSVTELAEVMNMLSDPSPSSRRLKQMLQGIFESKYSFDLEYLKKANLGKAVKELETLGASAFVVAYVSQHGLGGHAIPVNSGVYGALVSVGAITANEAASGRVPGLERAIPKSKGVEFASLIHQLGVDFQHNPHAPRMKGILQEINPDAELPKKEKPAEAGDSSARKRRSKRTKSGSETGSTRRTSRDQAKSSSKSAASKSATKPITKKKPK
jgi:hypothetical protein